MPAKQHIRAIATPTSLAPYHSNGPATIVKKYDCDERTPADPAFAILGDILGLVPNCGWAFARIERDALTSPTGPLVDARALVALDDEHRRQRRCAPIGPRIAATLVTFPGGVAGVTLIFADARAHYGILVLLRDDKLPPFSSVEIGMLTFSLAAGSERLAALRLRLAPDSLGGPPRRAQVPVTPQTPKAMYVLDDDFEIVLAWNTEYGRSAESSGAMVGAAQRLPPVLEQSVRELTADWSTTRREPGIAWPLSFLRVRTAPLSGRAGDFVGVHIDRFRPPNSLLDAAARFHISPREVQVLRLLLDGDHLDQIAGGLHITSSTVQDHIKSMLDKTKSRNRSELIARVLGWENALLSETR
jgi:DNA-binding CsgD family transcriptional regulator